MRRTGRLLSAYSNRHARLDMLQMGLSAIVDDVARIEGRGGLEEQDPAFFAGDGTMLNTTRDDDEFAFFDPLVTVLLPVLTIFHAETAFHYEEEFVFVFVVVEDEFAFEFIELDVLAVEFGGDVGLPVFGNLVEFFGDVDFVHGRSFFRIRGMLLRMWVWAEGRKKPKGIHHEGHEGSR